MIHDIIFRIIVVAFVIRAIALMRLLPVLLFPLTDHLGVYIFNICIQCFGRVAFGVNRDKDRGGRKAFAANKSMASALRTVSNGTRPGKSVAEIDQTWLNNYILLGNCAPFVINQLKWTADRSTAACYSRCTTIGKLIIHV